VSHTLDPSRIAEVLAAIADNTEKLNDWEREFFESVHGQWDAHGRLSEKQMEILERIYQKV
jgi:hypothetical protein